MDKSRISRTRGFATRRLLLSIALSFATAMTAHAERVRGQFRYADAGGNTTPIRFATVEIYRHRPGQIGWSMDMSTTTDNSGSINVLLPFAGSNVLTSLRVYADNPAVKVLKQDDPFQTFYQKPGWPGAEIQRVTMKASDVLQFGYTFPDEWSAAHYNAAHAVRLAKAYADARRDPRETDPINWLHVQIQNNAANTYYDPVSSRIRISVENAVSDLTVVHEYAHFLEHKISGFLAQATRHDGCQMLSAEPPWGVNVANPGLAWMEGFADYFAQAVALAFPGEITAAPDDTFATTSVENLEDPSAECGASLTPESIENYVGGALWDLIDNKVDGSDRMCARGLLTETLIFQIFDHELDLGRNPTLQEFVNAWSNRGLDLPPLLAAFGDAAINIVVPPLTRRYDPDFAADWAVWRPSNGTFYVLWNNGTSNASQWGQTGDVPVPEDYDGDGFTDVAVWRPVDGNWWVILSQTNRVQVTQWGTAGDIPLPADYDGDREIDFAVYRPSSGSLFIKSDTCGPDQTRTLGPGTPVVGRFDADQRADPGVFNGAAATFTIQRTNGGPLVKSVGTASPLVSPAPVIGDYDGDGRSDFATFAMGKWSILRSSTQYTVPVTSTFGLAVYDYWTGIYSFPFAVPADVDGDGRTDLAVWYAADGMWYAQGSIAGALSQQWGAAGDQPVPRR